MIGRIKRACIESIGRHNQFSFLKWQSHHLPISSKESDYVVVSFSGSKWFADQLYSLYSFYINVGKPESWLIYDDGTYSEAQITALQQIERVTVSRLEQSATRLPIEPLQKFPTLKKVEIVARHIPGKKTILTDSDVIFYNNFSKLINGDSEGNYFLVDEGNAYFDKDFLLQYSNIQHPFNFGLLLLQGGFDMEPVFAYIENRYKTGMLGYWSDQTAFQKLVMGDPGFKPLHKEQFKVGGKDAFTFSHCVNYNEIALRHFVGPVRHKMWQYPWKKVLGLEK
jgi:hypothetical protein